MGKKTNPAVIGAFVIGALSLVVVAVIVWGKGILSKNNETYVAYFPGSVNGLSIGAPVKIRGVQIGEVTDIRLNYRQVRGAPRVPVFMQVDVKRTQEVGGRRPTREVVSELITQGWRVRLQTLSIVTGVLYVEFDFVPGSPVELVQAEDAPYMEVPTVPTPLEEAAASLGKIVADLKTIDFQAIGKGVDATLKRVNAILARPEIDTALEELPKTIAAARRLVTNLDNRTDPLIASLRGASDDARRGLESLQATLEGVRGLIAPGTPLALEVTETVVGVGQSARALRDLADYLERNPNSVLFGRRDGTQ